MICEFLWTHTASMTMANDFGMESGEQTRVQFYDLICVISEAGAMYS